MVIEISSNNLTMINSQRVRILVLYNLSLGGLLELCYGNFPRWVRINKAQFRNPFITYGVIECSLKKHDFFIFWLKTLRQGSSLDL